MFTCKLNTDDLNPDDLRGISVREAGYTIHGVVHGSMLLVPPGPEGSLGRVPIVEAQRQMGTLVDLALAALEPGEEELERKLQSDVPNPSIGAPAFLDELRSWQMRQAALSCWRALPEDRRSVGEVGRQLRRLIDRAFLNIAEDMKEFDIRDPEPDAR